MNQDIPAGDYRREFAYLFAAIAAATRDADPGQRDQMQRLLVPHLDHVRRLAAKAGSDLTTRGELADTIATAQTTLRHIMGDNWQPNAHSDIGMALVERGHSPRTILPKATP